MKVALDNIQENRKYVPLMKNKRCHTVGTLPNSIRKGVFLITYINDRLLSWLGTDTLIKKWRDLIAEYVI